MVYSGGMVLVSPKWRIFVARIVGTAELVELVECGLASTLKSGMSGTDWVCEDGEKVAGLFTV